MNAPDFYLGSSESANLRQPRQCQRLMRLASQNRDDLLVIKVAPPVQGQPYGFDAQQRDLIMVTPRLEGESLFPISTFPDRPLPVYILWPLIANLHERTMIAPEEYANVAWGELYPSEHEARLGMTISQIALLNSQESLRRQVRPESVVAQPDQQELKKHLIEYFHKNGTVHRAYLARNFYRNVSSPQVAVYLHAPLDPDRELIDQVARILTAFYRGDEALDICYLLDEQDSELRSICDPFFEMSSLLH